LYFNDDENYVEFDTLSINTLSSVNQFELIEKWLKKTFDYTKEAIYTKNLDLIQSRVEDVI
jgi:hypothetical protein